MRTRYWMDYWSYITYMPDKNCQTGLKRFNPCLSQDYVLFTACLLWRWSKSEVNSTRHPLTCVFKSLKMNNQKQLREYYMPYILNSFQEFKMIFSNLNFPKDRLRRFLIFLWIRMIKKKKRQDKTRIMNKKQENNDNKRPQKSKGFKRKMKKMKKIMITKDKKSQEDSI